MVTSQLTGAKCACEEIAEPDTECNSTEIGAVSYILAIESCRRRVRRTACPSIWRTGVRFPFPLAGVHALCMVLLPNG